MTEDTLVIILLALFVVLPVAALGVCALKLAFDLRRDGETFGAAVAAKGGMVFCAGAVALVMLGTKIQPSKEAAPAEAPAVVVHKGCTCTCEEKP